MRNVHDRVLHPERKKKKKHLASNKNRKGGKEKNTIQWRMRCRPFIASRSGESRKKNVRPAISGKTVPQIGGALPASPKSAPTPTAVPLLHVTGDNSEQDQPAVHTKACIFTCLVPGIFLLAAFDPVCYGPPQSYGGP